MSEFLHMGGYAFYVWTSLGLAAALLGGIAAWSAAEARSVERSTFARALQPRRGAGPATGARIDPTADSTVGSTGALS